MAHPCLIFFFLFCLLNSRSFCIYTITSNQSLLGNQTLLSRGGNFVLGFFKPCNTCTNYYIGIWFNIHELTPVWVANREMPVSDPAATELKISNDGNLVLSQSGSMFWSTNITSTSSAVAVILDNGNLVILKRRNSSAILWQSFDHPTDSWLPGAKVGFSTVTGQTWKLTSWRSSNDPAPGGFTLELDPSGTSQLLILSNSTNVQWSSGAWNGYYFSRMPEIDTSNCYEVVSNGGEKYITYGRNYTSVFARGVVDSSGTFKEYVWTSNPGFWDVDLSRPSGKCDLYSFCGPFNICNENSLHPCRCMMGFHTVSGSGCARNTPLKCNGNQGDLMDIFFSISDVRLPPNYQIINAYSEADCKIACLRNCSCNAYSYNGICSLWYADLLNLQQLQDGFGQKLYIRVADAKSQKSREIRLVVLFVVIPAFVLVMIFATFRLVSHKHRPNISGGILVSYEYNVLKRASKNFSHRLGQGSFGSVFRGILSDSTVVAIKKLEGIPNGEKQFRAEVSTIGKIQHLNLVRLHGFCSQDTRRLLVYEYMPNSSLDTHLFKDKHPVLDWKTRYSIALGIAKGLAYLHENCQDCILHCDIKPENILLDSNFDAKIADFGMAKLLGRDYSRVLTTLRGTIGYLAPEWISGMPITVKADTYSYGMMLLEIISGRRNAVMSEDDRYSYFPVFAARKIWEDDILCLLDHRLEENASIEEVRRACRIACWCIQEYESLRPSMAEVVHMLEQSVDVQVPPVSNFLQNLVHNDDERSVSR